MTVKTFQNFKHVCPSVYLPIYRPIYLYTSVSVYICICLSVYKLFHSLYKVINRKMVRKIFILEAHWVLFNKKPANTSFSLYNHETIT